MGNESSKAAVERTNEILADFTADERAMLDQIFNEWLSEEMNDQRQGAKGKDIVSGGSVKSHLPCILPSSLLRGLILLFHLSTLHSSSPPLSIPSSKLEKLLLTPISEYTISRVGFYSSIRKLTKQSIVDQAEATYIVSQLECARNLGDFVADVVKLGVELWFDRGGHKESGKKVADDKRNETKNHHGNKKGCGSSEVTGDRNEALVEYLLVQSLLKQGEVEDENAQSNFLKECSYDGYFSLDKYTEWYSNNLPFQKLTIIAMARLFLMPPIEKLLLPDSQASVSSSSLQLVRLQQSMLIRPRISSPFPYPAFSNLLTPSDYFCVCQHLPPDCVTTPHQLLFSSIIDGKSWTSFLSSILYVGSTLLILKSSKYIFGGFAYSDWELAPKFYGSNEAFLFSIRPKLRIYKSSRYNDHYQYLNSGTETLRNGLGMGGQLEYPALWIEEGLIRGESRAGPVSTTYGSVCLSGEEFFEIEEIEVWLVKPTTRDPDSLPHGPKHSVLDRHPAELELLEMATSRKMYSKDVREPDVLPADGDNE
ncbi:10109_t:CDS:2 [Paraglomus brasilianum]|uniref:MTOR-associated protein MEAK7 n=1 Tax=Paraglomus brasilianum TaxID=144538 RepID=A0A9N9CQR9_9GLOM|nr:10109_t:CDS:2 [Paraglomus brasilianum]